MALQVKPISSGQSAPASRITGNGGARGASASTRPEVESLSTDFNVGSQDEQILQQDYAFNQNGGQERQNERLSSQTVAYAYELHESEEAERSQSAGFGGMVRKAGSLPPYEVARGVAIYEQNMTTIANGGKYTGSQLSYAI